MVNNGSDNIYLYILYEMIKTGQFQVMYSQHKRKYGTAESYFENEVHILSAIVEDNNVNLLDLAKKFFKTKSYISQIVSKLEQMNLIKKYKSKEDSRKTVYKVTAKGVKLYNLHNEYDLLQAERLRNFIGNFTKEELSLFISVLDKYHEFQLDNPNIKNIGL